MQFRFGAGSMVATPATDNSGSTIVAPTPMKLGVVQMVSLDHSFDLKELYGENGIAIDIAGGKQKITGKLQVGQVSALAYAALVWGVPVSAGNGVYLADDLVAAVPASAPYTYVAAPANSGVFAGDKGVRDAQGVPMTKVTGTPTTGQYSVNATGTYTFAAADAGLPIYPAYTYVVAAAGKRISVVNTRMGALPSFSFDYGMKYEGRSVTIQAYNCVRSKTNIIGSKVDDYDTFELDYQVFAHPVSGRVLDLTFSE